MTVRIITDSTADVTPEAARQLNIGVVALKVLFGHEEYRDGIDLNIEEFYAKLTGSGQLPTTSQPSPNDFLPEYEKAKAAGEEILVLTLSSQLSGTCQSAQLAKDYCEYEPIYIVDSLSATIGTQLLLREAIRLRDAGQSARQIAAQLDQLKSRIVVLAAVDTLEFLVKGGRLSKAAGFAGSLLGIHPMITLEEGKLSVLGKARGKKATLQLFWQQMEKLGMPDPQVEPIFGYTGNREAVSDLIAFLEEKAIVSSQVCGVGSVIGTHTGPGVSAIAYLRQADC